MCDSDLDLDSDVNSNSFSSFDELDNSELESEEFSSDEELDHYISHNKSDMNSILQSVIRQCTEQKQVHEAVACVLLIKYQFDTRNIPNVKSSTSIDITGQYDSASNITLCPVCLEDSEMRYGLSCNHWVCTDCFKQYLEINRNELLLKCPGNAKCSKLITNLVYEDLNISRDYSMLLMNAFITSSNRINSDNARKLKNDKSTKGDSNDISDNNSFRLCPFPDCEYTIERLLNTEKVVQCSSNHNFCFDCGSIPHLNIQCEIAAEWLALVDEDIRSQSWINDFTKQCPQCRTRIQKSEGCNHMSCSNCRYQFCWVCSLSWADHSGNSYYICSKVANYKKSIRPSKDKKEDAKLQKYIKLFESNLSMSNSSTSDVLKKSYEVLAWGYVIVYMSTETNNRIILENLLQRLIADIDQNSNVAKRSRAIHDFISNEFEFKK